jgi:putative hemolysin
VTAARRHFTLAPHLPQRLGRLRTWLAPALDRLLGLSAINELYPHIPVGLPAVAFARRTLAGLGVAAYVDEPSLARVPARGAAIVVANHPHGALDGLLMLDVLARRRGDVRVMANYLLSNFVELAETFIGVDPFGGAGAGRTNFLGLRQALNWLRRGGLLLVFPGGEVSSLSLARRAVCDPPWDAGVAWLADKSGATLVPASIDGRNSNLFQLVGLLDRRLRTLLLVREMFGQRGRVITITCGRPLDIETLRRLEDHRAQAAYLQTLSDLLRASRRFRKPLRLLRTARAAPVEEPIRTAIDAAVLAAEIAALQPDACLAVSGEREVWSASAAQIPALMQELGRQREIAFRAVGEGTGRSVDIDLYDSYYLHLILWDRAAHAVIGGYRLGLADHILAHHGARGLYVNSLFGLAPSLESELTNAIEVGRSFVRADYQRSHASLMLLWKGIGAFLARHPHYRSLFGPVSISNDYHPLSQQLMVRFLEHHSMETARASLVKPRQPFRRARHGRARLVDLSSGDLRIIAPLLSAVEGQDVDVPVLLRQYLKLNGRILGFNVDPEFNNALDCLLWLDLDRTEPELLRRYMGNEGAARFLAYRVAVERAERA